MDNTTLKACITKALKKEFPSCKIYKDKQSSNVKLPAFFVRYLKVSQVKIGFDFYEQIYIVETRYWPEENLAKNELSTHLDLIGGQVADLLQVVRGDNFSARAGDIDCETSDGVLIVLASYKVKKRIVPAQDPYMETLKENEEVKQYV